MWGVPAVVLGVLVSALPAQPADARQAFDDPLAAPALTAAPSAVQTLRVRDGVTQLVDRGVVVRQLSRTSAAPLVLDGTPGNDTLRVDFRGGNPVPGGLVFDGRADTAGPGDGLELVGGRFEHTRVTLLPDRPGLGHDGTIELDGTVIEFRDLEPVDLGPATADLSFSVPTDAQNNLTVLENDAGNVATKSQLRSVSDSFETVTFTHPTSTLTVNLGNDTNENLDVLDDSVARPINVVGGTGGNVLRLADGKTLTGGQFNGGSGTDTISYSGWTSPASVNLGLNAPGLTATLGPDQEVPPTSTSAGGTASLTYDNVARTFGISVAVTGIAPASVTGFHIHSAAVGVNGPVIVDFGTGSLTPSGDGFTFNAGNVALPAAHEAALLGGATYVNVHTGAVPSGVIRGQLMPTGALTAATGTSTGTGGLVSIENVTGGTDADSIVGGTGNNGVTAATGNDTVVAGPGSDSVTGGSGSDLIAWTNGDGTDVLDGSAGTDRVQVSGAAAGTGDAFTVATNGGRVDLDRLAPAPFSLSIGSTEALSMIGLADDDALTVGDLSAIADLAEIGFHGFSGNDTMSFASAGSYAGVMRGGTGTNDALAFDAGCIPTTTTADAITAQGRPPFAYSATETVDVASAIRFGSPSATFAEGDGTAQIPVVRTGTLGASIDHATAGATATSPADYAATSGTHVFGGAQTAANVAVPLVADGVPEGDEAFTATLSNPSPGDHLCEPSSFTATLTDTAPPVTTTPTTTTGSATEPPPTTSTVLGATTTTPAPTAPPPAPIRFAFLAVTPSTRTGGARVRLRLPARGTVDVVARIAGRPTVIARGRLRGRGPGTAALTIRPTTAGRRLLTRKRSQKVRLTATFTPTTGSRSTATRTTTLRLTRRR